MAPPGRAPEWRADVWSGAELGGWSLGRVLGEVLLELVHGCERWCGILHPSRHLPNSWRFNTLCSGGKQALLHCEIWVGTKQMAKNCSRGLTFQIIWVPDPRPCPQHNPHHPRGKRMCIPLDPAVLPLAVYPKNTFGLPADDTYKDVPLSVRYMCVRTYAYIHLNVHTLLPIHTSTKYTHGHLGLKLNLQ